jgi:hypothetical protein
MFGWVPHHPLWLVYLAVSAGYTLIVFWVLTPKGRASASSIKKTAPLQKALLIHLLFVASLCGFIWLISSDGESLSWLTWGFGEYTSRLWALCILAIPLGMLERLWLFGDCVIDFPDTKEDSDETVDDE